MVARRLVGGIGAVFVAGTMLIACGSDSKSDDATVTVETYVTVPEAQVVSGFAATQALMDAMTAAPSTANDATIAAISDGWLMYEGNIKNNDANTYLAAEDALALFAQAARDNDSGGMKSAADKFRQLAATYTAAHPG